MRRLIVLALLFAACGDNSEPYTWGDMVAELATDFCQTYADHCTSRDVDVELCAEHDAWHLCEPNYSCDVEVDHEAAEAALTKCHEAMNPEPGADYDYDTVCYVIDLGFLPSGCGDLWSLDPGPQGADAG